MKKGYHCPQCGNNETEALLADRGGCKTVTVYMLPQKILRSPDVRISCSRCGWLANAELFRMRRASETFKAL